MDNQVLFPGVTCCAPHRNMCVWDQKWWHLVVQAARLRCSRRSGACSCLTWHLAQDQQGMCQQSAAS